MRTGNTKLDKVIAKMSQEPLLIDADELTAKIMTTIDGEEQFPEKVKKRFIMSIIQRSLAVASVIIVMIFGIEQYIVIHKVEQLEIKVSNIEPNKRNINPVNFVNYNFDICISVISHIPVMLATTSLSKIRSPKYLRFNL